MADARDVREPEKVVSIDAEYLSGKRFPYQESIKEKWFPSYGPNGWKMAFMAGNGSADRVPVAGTRSAEKGLARSARVG